MSQLSLLGESPKDTDRGRCLWSPDHKYRYLLSWPVPSHFRTPRLAVMVGLNPSTADESKLDPTLTRFQGFAKAWGCTRMAVLNLFALVSTDPKGMAAVADPVGPDNDHTIRITLGGDAAEDTIVVAAWGGSPNGGQACGRGDGPGPWRAVEVPRAEPGRIAQAPVVPASRK